jgi:hypothetical protein
VHYAVMRDRAIIVGGQRMEILHASFPQFAAKLPATGAKESLWSASANIL